MIPGYLNSLLAITLVYLSILKLPLLQANKWVALAAGIAIIVLALWSRAGDMMKWFSTVNIVLGAMLLGFGIWEWVAPFADLFVFWFIFWTGVLVGVVALWGAIYRAPGKLYPVI